MGERISVRGDATQTGWEPGGNPGVWRGGVRNDSSATRWAVVTFVGVAMAVVLAACDDNDDVRGPATPADDPGSPAAA
jgi:hypothetical protein